MKTSLYKLILLAGLAFSGAVVLNSCSKADAVNSISQPTSTERNSFGGVTTNVLFDHDLLVTYAKDNGTDITSNFNGITFHFSGYPEYSGYGWAANDLLAVNGTWTRDKDLTMINFAFPTNLLPVLSFMNKDWNVVSFNGPVVLRAANGEDDELTLNINQP